MVAACAAGNIKRVQVLYHKPGGQEALPEALQVAATAGHADTVEFILIHASAMLRPATITNALMCAVNSNQPATVIKLMSHPSADITHNANHLLMWAATFNDSAHCTIFDLILALLNAPMMPSIPPMPHPIYQQ